MQAQSGLFSIQTSETTLPTPIPLCGVSVEARVDGAASAVTLHQRFRNTEAKPIEAVYVFPLPTHAAVCGFVAEVDGRRIVGEVEEREKAFDRYDDAIADGHGAFLVDQERPNIFTVSVGNLAPKSEAVIELRWVMMLPTEGPAYRFQLPTTVSPRYVPASETPEVGEPDGDRINPDRLPTVPYGLDLKVDIANAEMPRRIESPTHAIRTSFGVGEGKVTRVELGQSSVALDRDFVLVIEPPAIKPAARVGLGPDGARYVQVDFIPTLEGEHKGAEVVFIVDCSGSMGGTSIDEAKRALELCVRALDEGDSFDIVRFGSSHQSLFGTSRPFSEDTLKAALAYIAATNADLGGTEILAPLRAVCDRPGQFRNILLLTDGQVSNESNVIALAESHSGRRRIFSFGIGAGASEHLVREVATASRGEAEMIAPGERIEPKVLRQFGRVRSPVLEDIKIDWGLMEVEAYPRHIPAIFGGDPLVVSAKVKAGHATELTLMANGQRWSVPLDLERADAKSPVPTLWARAAIGELETGERHGSSQRRPRSEPRTSRVVELAKAFGLMSSQTSFVAVEVRSPDKQLTSGVELRKVPVALTAGWGGTGAAHVPKPKRGMRKLEISQAINSISLHEHELVSRFDALEKAGPSMRHMRIAEAEPLFAKVDELAMTLFHHAAPAPAPAAASAWANLSVTGEPSPTAPSTPTDPVFALLGAQRFDGSFDSGAILPFIAHRDRWTTAVKTHGEGIVATLAVLHHLEQRHSERRDEWRAAAAKARRYLAKLDPAKTSFDASTLF
jgi:Ca-activated chloride channel family protein